MARVIPASSNNSSHGGIGIERRWEVLAADGQVAVLLLGAIAKAARFLKHRHVVPAPYYSVMQVTGLPVVGEAPQDLIDLVSGGQPVLLLGHDGEPVAVVVDYDSYQEA